MQLHARRHLLRGRGARVRGGGLGEDVYDGAATFGRFMSWVSLITGNIVGVVLVCIGASFAAKKPYGGHAAAKVVTSECRGNGSDRKCQVEVSYQVKNETYNKVMDVNRPYAKGETLALRYDAANPANSATGITARAVGFILLAVGLVIAAGAWVSWYIAQRFKFAAAATGVGAAWDIVT